MHFRHLMTIALLCSVVGAASAEVVPRQTPVAGAVVSVRVGEEARFVEGEGWRGVEPTQQIRSGDVLKTNAIGQLAILFEDQTQIRLGRNSTLVVKELVPGGDSRLELQSGSIWGRAARGGSAVSIDTPAAAAAIRGTDWSLSVDADGRTSLVVMEGLVELSNPQGSVSVAGGEAAVAAIGEAPTKIVVVSPDDREQMLFYVSLRDAFTLLPPWTGPSREAGAARRRIDAMPPAARSTEDLVLRAELALNYDGRDATLAAVAAARAAGPDPRQSARLDLVEAFIAANAGRHAEAAAGFAAAAPRLDPERREIAAYAGYFAGALADPGRAAALPPAASSPYAAAAAAFAVGFLENTRAALDAVAEAERRWPDEPYLPAVRAYFAMLIDDRAQMKAALDRSLELDPGNPFALQARAYYRAGYESDLDGALADAEGAIEAAPGAASNWNTLSLIQGEREAVLEADAAIGRAIALDPENPLYHANRAIQLMEANRMAEARAEIDKVFALDPSFHVAWTALGRWHLQNGDTEAAIEALLKATTANPAHSQSLLLLAAAYYQNGERDPSEQSLDNAERMDPNDPVVPTVRTRMALDRYEADEALAAAREALRRTRARGGAYAGLGASRQAGSVLSEAFRFAGLGAWGRYYGNVAFDPFVAGGYFDASVDGNVDPFAVGLDRTSVRPEPVGVAGDFSAMIQGLLLDPLAIASSSRRTMMLRSPFVEVEAGGGFVSGDDPGWTASGSVNAYAHDPLPFSLYADVSASRADPANSNVDEDRLIGTVILGATPTPADRFVAFGIANDLTDPVPGTVTFPFPDERRDGTSYLGGLGWSHTLGHRNVVNVAVMGSMGEDQVPFLIAIPPQSRLVSSDSRSLAVSAEHLLGIGDVTLRSGVEAGTSRETLVIDGIPGEQVTETAFVGGHVDAVWEPTDDLALSAGVAVRWREDGDESRVQAAPRVGVAWSVFEGHWLRAFAVHDVEPALALTLAPVDVLGLRQDEATVGLDGSVSTVGARWDAEWSSRFFTSLDWQHHWFDDLRIANPINPLDVIAVGDGSMDRVSLTANLWLGHGFGAFATGSYTWSDDGAGEPLPYVPETSARAGITWSHPSRVRATLAGTWIGERSGGGGAELDGAFTLDGSLRWEPFDRRMVFDLGVYNILDEDFDVAPDSPGWGRTVVGTVKVRF